MYSTTWSKRNHSSRFLAEKGPEMVSKLSMRKQRVDLGSWPRCVRAPKLTFFPHIHVVSLESQCDGFMTLLIPRSYWTSTESSSTNSMLKQLSQRTLGDTWKLWSCGSLAIVSELLTDQVSLIVVYKYWDTSHMAFPKAYSVITATSKLQFNKLLHWKFTEGFSSTRHQLNAVLKIIILNTENVLLN